MFNNILAGVDGSENSTRALTAAAEISLKFDSELVVFHAISHFFQFPNLTFPAYRGPVIDPNALKGYLESAGKVILDNAKKTIEELEYAAELKVDYILELDKTPEEFAVDYASENAVDLIVIGCKGHHGRFRRALLGTIATRISNEAPCQVLLVR
jgi:nucleotide-binding universal stress UspA family protein